MYFVALLETGVRVCTLAQLYTGIGPLYWMKKEKVDGKETSSSSSVFETLLPMLQTLEYT